VEHAQSTAQRRNDMGARGVVLLVQGVDVGISDAAKRHLHDAGRQLERRPSRLPGLVAGKGDHVTGVDDQDPQLVDVQTRRVVAVPATHLEVEAAVRLPRLVLGEDLLRLAVVRVLEAVEVLQDRPEQVRRALGRLVAFSGVDLEPEGGRGPFDGPVEEGNTEQHGPLESLPGLDVAIEQVLEKGCKVPSVLGEAFLLVDTVLQLVQGRRNGGGTLAPVRQGKQTARQVVGELGRDVDPSALAQLFRVRHVLLHAPTAQAVHPPVLAGEAAQVHLLAPVAGDALVRNLAGQAIPVLQGRQQRRAQRLAHLQHAVDVIGPARILDADVVHLQLSRRQTAVLPVRVRIPVDVHRRRALGMVGQHVGCRYTMEQRPRGARDGRSMGHVIVRWFAPGGGGSYSETSRRGWAWALRR